MMNNATFEDLPSTDSHPHTTHNMAAGLDIRLTSEDYLETVDDDDGGTSSQNLARMFVCVCVCVCVCVVCS